MHRDRHVAPEVLDDLAHDPLDLVRQRAAVRVAQDEARRAPAVAAAFEHAQRELGVAPVAVEEVLGVEEHLHPALRRNSTESPTIATPSSSVVPSASVTW